MNKENRLFIRPLGVIARDSRFDSTVIPHIFGNRLVRIDVAGSDTRHSAGTKVAQALASNKAENLPCASNSRTRTDYSDADVNLAATAFAETVLQSDLNAARMAGSACMVVQVIAIDDESAALDLYMECLSRIENGETLNARIAPQSYRQDTYVIGRDGGFYSRQEAAEDNGTSVSSTGTLAAHWACVAPAVAVAEPA